MVQGFSVEGWAGLLGHAFCLRGLGFRARCNIDPRSLFSLCRTLDVSEGTVDSDTWHMG